MKPKLIIRKSMIERRERFGIISEARTAMINHATRQARENKRTAEEIRYAQCDADARALLMSRACMRVRTFEEALEFVKDNVDIEII